MSKSFDSGRHFVLRDVSLAVRPASFVALVGGSGAGKTTLLKCINRLLALEPLVGAISIERMRAADMMVDRATDRVSPSAAAQWLAEQTGLN